MPPSGSVKEQAVLVLEWAAWGSGVALMVWAINALERHSRKRFRHAFLTKSALVGFLAIGVGMMAGHKWWQTALHEGGDPLNGLLLMSASAAAITYAVIRNVRHSSLTVGLGGSLMQMALFSSGALLGFFALLLALLVFAMLTPGSQPGYAYWDGYHEHCD